MYLKRLEMQGFKSFADKTILEFRPGITGVIGPNGSGKSNISDAIRWILGEQSMKSLRGNKTQDIIFAGTQNRKSLGFAEASLVFDNTDGTLPIEFSEVTITRKIYRSGETGYYINKAPCRLKDVIELFMDTGIGRDGYSIIGQGKVDEILSNKSEDRRHIFEEAAGIVKYRARKAESEKKLENTKYHFVFVQNRKKHDITLNFCLADFRHAAGLHHITDIVIENNLIKTMDAILRSDFPEITDTKLNESRKYKEISPTSGSVRERVSDMRFIEQCLDTSNFMRIFKLQPYGSQIRADYFIEAYCNEIKANVYVFLRKREESDNYVVVSYFRKKTVVSGISTYWLLKEKISDDIVNELLEVLHTNKIHVLFRKPRVKLLAFISPIYANYANSSITSSANSDNVYKNLVLPSDL